MLQQNKFKTPHLLWHLNACLNGSSWIHFLTLKNSPEMAQLGEMFSCCSLQKRESVYKVTACMENNVFVHKAGVKFKSTASFQNHASSQTINDQDFRTWERSWSNQSEGSGAKTPSTNFKPESLHCKNTKSYPWKINAAVQILGWTWCHQNFLWMVQSKSVDVSQTLTQCCPKLDKLRKWKSNVTAGTTSCGCEWLSGDWIWTWFPETF